MAGIYCIESDIKPDHIYIGSSIDPIKRIREHKKDLKGNHHTNKKLQNHFNKYGLDDFIFTLLEDFQFTSKDDLIKREQEYIDVFNPKFNICKIAGTTLGYRHTDEAKKKIGDGSRGNKYSLGCTPSQETRDKISKGSKGRVKSEEEKKKISTTLQGHPVSEETRRKLQIANKGRNNRIGYKMPEESKLRIALARMDNKACEQYIREMDAKMWKVC